MDELAATTCDLEIPLALIAIGASAGGLAPLETLFEQLPADTGASFVVVQHLSPDYESHMSELLARRTNMKAEQLSSAVEPRANHVYLLPPDKHLEFAAGKLHLCERDAKSIPSLPIDRFFRSLGRDCQIPFAAVVLSGTGSDGAEGIEEVASAGGLVLCQDEDSSQFGGMPLNAMKTGLVHAVGSVPELADVLVNFIGGASIEEIVANNSAEMSYSDLEPIYKTLSHHTGIDFNEYRDGTFNRRLSRRMMLSGIDDIAAYVKLLERDQSEVSRLSNDLLIGVTRFFRDGDGYQRLQTRAIKPTMRNKKPGSEYRAWVAGCASGQEAYSIAMLLHEEREQANSDIAIQIFATDVHPDAVRYAQAGIYPSEALNEIPPHLREKYVERTNEGFTFREELRNSIVFARHDLLSDAPFANLDLLTCRNLLIYLREDAQQEVLKRFVHALRVRGILWLGPSETPANAGEAFTTLDKYWRVFQKERDVKLPVDLKLRKRDNTMPRQALLPSRSQHTPSAAMILSYDRLLEIFAPKSVLVDSTLTPLQVFGDLSDYLRAPSGRLGGTLADIVRNELKTPLMLAYQRLRRLQNQSQTETVRFNGDDINVSIRPLQHSSIGDTHYLVTFEKQSSSEDETQAALEFQTPRMATVKRGAAADDDLDTEQRRFFEERVRMLEMELDFTRENLQATVEELETTNEELQSSNEELTSSNEELQSTNEELHSVNEELHSAHSESERRVQLLGKATADLERVLAATSVGIILFDSEDRVSRLNESAAQCLRVDMEEALGRAAETLTLSPKEFGLAAQISQVRQQGKGSEVEVKNHNGDPLLVRTEPYGDDESVIVAVTNLASIRRTTERLQRLSSIVADSPDAIIGVDFNQCITSWNNGAKELFGRDIHEDDQEVLADALPEDLSRRCEYLLRKVKRSQIVAPDEVRCSIGDASRVLLVRVTPVFAESGVVASAAITVSDVSVLREAEEQLRIRNRAIDAANNGIIVVDAKIEDLPIIYSNDGFTQLTGFTPDEIRGRNCRFLQGPGTDPADVTKIRRAVKDKESCRVTLLNYRKDGSQFYNDLIISPVFDEDGAVTHFVGVQNDVTALVEANDAVRRSEAEYRSTFETAAVGIAHVGFDGTWLRVNDKLCEIVGYTQDELAEKTFQDITHPDDVDADLKQFMPLMRGEIIGYSMEKRYVHKEGHIVWINLTTSLRRSPAGEPECCISIVEDISKRKATEKELVASQAIVTEVIQNTHDVFASFDNRGNLNLLNEAARRLTLSDVADESNRSMQEVFSASHAAPLLSLLERVGVSRVPETVEYLAPQLNRWYDVRAFSVADGVALIMSDITARKETETHLEQARLAAEDASRAKTEFLANMSHEIRSPMTAILGFSDFALRSIREDGTCDESYLETIIRNGRFLLRVINDILDLSKVEAGKLDVHKKRFQVLPMLADISELMRHRSKTEGVPLQFEFKGRIPAKLFSDRSRVEQILVNLIGNALKFTNEGEVRVIVSASKNSFSFQVVDTGIGISPEGMKNLFAAFSQVHSDTQGTFEGTGLGLAISQRLAGLLGGNITVQSELGHGSTFELTLPLAVSDETQMILANPDDLAPRKIANTGLARLSESILVVDDMRDVRFVATHVLRKAGADVYEATNGVEAIAAVRQADQDGTPFSCILMDMQMPEMDGRAATSLLRAEGYTTPVIALTAGATSDEVDAAMKAGCTEFFSKPIDSTKLIELVARLVKLK